MLKIKHCWILTSVRSGSWMLSSVLDQTNQFDGSFKEYMHWHHPNKNCYPSLCKVIRRHFLSCHNDQTDINNKLPNIKYIWLHRNNNYERAISLYFSLITNKWQNKQQTRVFNIELANKQMLKLDQNLALACYAEVSSDYHNNWNNFLSNKNYLYINYDNLISDTNNQLQLIFQYLNMPPLKNLNIDIKSSKMKKPQTNEFVQQLKELVDKNPLPNIDNNSNTDVYREIQIKFCK